MVAFFNLAILDLTILVFPLILTHTCQDWFPPFAQKKTYSHLPPHHLHKKTSLIHSDSTWWWQPSWILPSWILPSWIQPFCTKLWLKLIQFDSNSFIVTQLDDGSHLEFCHAGFIQFAQKKNLPYSFSINLMMAAILNPAMLDSDTAILDSDTLLSFLRFTQKYSHSNLTLTQINSIWLKLIHSHLTWWWQPSWILPSWIQPFCTKKTSLIHSDST